MAELHPHAGQQHPVAAEELLEEAVVAALAEGGVADDGVGDVLEVAPELVAPAGVGGELDEGVAAGGVAVDLVRQLTGGEAAEVGDGGLGFVGAALADPLGVTTAR